MQPEENIAQISNEYFVENLRTIKEKAKIAKNKHARLAFVYKNQWDNSVSNISVVV